MMKFVVLIISIVLFGICSADDAIVQTKYGPIKGLVFPEYRRFEGVPFAEPPLGKLRWMNPTPPTPWTSVKDCTNFDIGCAQNAHSLDVPKNTSEDCLYLEVWTPPVGKYSEKAAVMLWFYGGDFKEGGESFKLYNGRYMSSTSNTILVATNYRVANLGFFYSPYTDPNVGIEDQRFSIQWVYDNIASFGGNPNQITIFGQSAGGQSVEIHLASPEAYTAKLFQGAIVESGPIGLQFKYPEAALLLGEEFAIKLGCDFQDLSCMQSKTTKEVLKASDHDFIIPLNVGEAAQQWAPVITSDKSLPLEPLEAFILGNIVKVPILIGSNLNDGVLFGYAINQDMSSEEYIGIVSLIIHNKWIPNVLEAYPPVFGGNNSAILSKFLTDYLFLCPSRYIVRKAEAAGIDSTYYYQFSYQLPKKLCFWPPHQKFCCENVCHGDEIPLVYHDNGSPFPWNMTQPTLSLSSDMSKYWTSFAHFGNPNKYNSGSTPSWPIYRQSTDLNMNLDWPNLKPVSGLEKQNCDMFDQIGYFH